MIPRPDLLLPSSPSSLEVFQLTTEALPSSHVYMEAQIFAPIRSASCSIARRTPMARTGTIPFTVTSSATSRTAGPWRPSPRRPAPRRPPSRPMGSTSTTLWTRPRSAPAAWRSGASGWTVPPVRRWPSSTRPCPAPTCAPPSSTPLHHLVGRPPPGPLLLPARRGARGPALGPLGVRPGARQRARGHHGEHLDEHAPAVLPLTRDRRLP